MMVKFYGKIREAPGFAEKRERKKMFNMLLLFIASDYQNPDSMSEFNRVRNIQIIKSDKSDSENPIVLEYLDRMKEEFDVHENKMAFVKRMKEAYEQDPNTPRYPPEAKLPLGKEFQDHLLSIVPKDVSNNYDTSNIPSLVRALEHSLLASSKLSEYEQMLQVDIDTKSLNIIRALLENETMQFEANSPSSKLYQEKIGTVRMLQNSLNHHGGKIYLFSCWVASVKD